MKKVFFDLTDRLCIHQGGLNMAQYDNLKDYFQGEHLELITNAIKEHLEHEVKSDYQIKCPVHLY